MSKLYLRLLHWLWRSVLRSKRHVALENLALRQQLIVLQRSVKRPRLERGDRIFWSILADIWDRWRECCVIVEPETILAWHKKGFKALWRWKSRGAGRPRIPTQIRELIRRISRDNPRWGAPRILGELERPGICVSQTTVERYMVRSRKPLSPTWKSFLANQAKGICACDFFVVPTIMFKLLFVFVLLSHDRRKITHVNVTSSPSAKWAGQQFVEAFPYDTAPKFLIHDRDRILAYVQFKLTNGLVEGINNKLRTIARRAYGFHSANPLISMLFLCAGGIQLNPPLPGSLPT